MQSTDRGTDPRITSAESLYCAGRPGDSLNLLLSISEGSIKRREDFLLVLGASYARLRRTEEAARTFVELLSIHPNCFEAVTWMAVLKKNRREIQEAIGYAERAIDLKPDDGVGYSALGSCYLYLAEPIRASEEFTRATQLAPDVPEHEHNLALSLLMAHRHGEAISHLRRAIALSPNSPQSYLALAGAYSLYGMAGEALQCLSQGLSELPECAPLHSAAASAFSMIRNDEAAERHHRRAFEISKDARGDYATWLLNQGRFQDASTILNSMIEDGSDPAFGYYGLMQTKRLSTADHSFAQSMRDTLAQGKLRPGSEMYLHYALGKAEEQLKDFEAAMCHFDSANELAYTLNHAGRPIDAAKFREEQKQVQTLYEGVVERSGEGNPSSAPIFIVGMIRSGTTLLDQIVSSHPEVSSGGELRFWIEETLRLTAKSNVPTREDLTQLADAYLRYIRLLAGSDSYITDKMPLNFAYLGIIHEALPNAKFLHIRRNPIDTCLSIYTTYFGKGALFAYRKPNIVGYYRHYLQAMNYWRSKIPQDRLLELDYEALVSEPQKVIPRIIEFCGLHWDEACLNHDKNEGAINTPSRWQARQPVYRTSMERWRKFEPWLGEFAELMEDQEREGVTGS